jgi:deoxycytidine triphosphate deaminase
VYLADRDIHALLGSMDIHCDSEAHPFVADDQVQPASIDLRLSSVFWKPSVRARVVRRTVARRQPLDLRRSFVEEIHPRRDWKRFDLRDGESVTLKPGGIIMARIYVRFAIPHDYAGKVEGRSSYARLGLMVHCTGDFINPGWRGYLPLQLYNAGPFPLRVYPYLSICQLMLIRLSSSPTHTYGDPELESKYMNDDGGPSYWWRERRVQRLQEQLTKANLSLKIVHDIVALVRFQDPDLLEHFERFVMRRKAGDLENAEAILDAFSMRENRRRVWDRIGKAMFPILLAALLASLFAKFGTLHALLIAASALAAIWSLYSWFWQPATYLGTPELASARKERDEVAATLPHG